MNGPVCMRLTLVWCLRMWDMSYVNNVASAQAKINLWMSLPFSYRLCQIRVEWSLHKQEAKLFYSVVVFVL